MLILPLFGVNAAAAVADLELLQRLDVPLFLLFDSTRQKILRQLVAGKLPTGDQLSHEERQLTKLSALWDRNRFRRPSCRSNHLTSSAGFQRSQFDESSPTAAPAPSLDGTRSAPYIRKRQ